MATDKPPFKLTITLESYRPDALNQAIEHLNELCNQYDQTGELKAKATIESWKEDPLLAIRAEIEQYLRLKKLIIEGKVTLESPVVRPPITLTPMEKAIEALRPKVGDGVDYVELSTASRSVRLEPR
jgi:hypothetical protein